jgi:AraC-like DNA-binding protein
LLGRAISDLVDRAVPLVDLWGEDGSRLVPALAELSLDLAALSLDSLVEPFQLALDSRLGRGVDGDRSSDHLVERAARMLSPGPDVATERVTAVARRVGISDRQLRNLFADAVGVSPKRFAQIERVRAVLARARAEGLAAVAAELGYFDQSHMTAQFRRLVGVPPRAFFAGRLPAAARCASAPAGRAEPLDN